MDRACHRTTRRSPADPPASGLHRPRLSAEIRGNRETLNRLPENRSENRAFGPDPRDSDERRGVVPLNIPAARRKEHQYNRRRMMRRVYLDNNATTPLLPEVLEAMQPYFGEHFGNASSIHHHGQETRAAVERARASVAALLGSRAAEIVFSSGGTEGDNLAIAGLTNAGDHVITSSIEHHAVLHACKHLEEIGCEVTYVPVDGRGLVDPD